jgi:hypothetical protein
MIDAVFYKNQTAHSSRSDLFWMNRPVWSSFNNTAWNTQMHNPQDVSKQKAQARAPLRVSPMRVFNELLNPMW